MHSKRTMPPYFVTRMALEDRDAFRSMRELGSHLQLEREPFDTYIYINGLIGQA